MKDIKTVPIWHSLKGVSKFVENPIEVIDEALKIYGDSYYTRIVGGKKLVMTVDPDVIQHVLQKNNKNYHKSEIQTESLGKYVGYGLLTSNGEYWLRQRRLIQPGFHKKKLEALTQIMHTEIIEIVNELKIRLKEDSVVDINQEMLSLTLRVVSKALFSTGIDQKTILQLGESFTKLQEHIVKEVRQPLFNWWRKLNGQMRDAQKLAAATRGIVQNIIDQRLASEQEYDDLLAMLLDSRYEDTGEKMSATQLLDEAIILFVAGHETSANALAWTFYLLGKNPKYKTKMSQEAKAFSEVPSMEDLIMWEFSLNSLNESMRIYPPAWILDRVALSDDNAAGVAIKKGDLLGLYVYGTHHNEKLWDNPKSFIPERFDRSKVSERHNYAFFPFGGGPRMCIGSHFALLEMQLVLQAYFQSFDYRLVSELEMSFKPLISLRPKSAILLEMAEVN